MGIFRHIRSLFATFALGLLVPVITLQAQFVELWQVGTDSFDLDEFEDDNNGNVDPAPGSALALDDHFYTAGTYPDPIGTVAEDESLAFFEPGLVSGDPSIRIYFPAPASNPEDTHYVLSFRTIWKGYWISAESRSGETPGNHHFQIRCNGVDVTPLLVAPYLENTNHFTVSFPGQPLTPEGFNYVEIQHMGGTTPEGDPFPNSYWASLDYVRLNAHPTGSLDTDNDGLPLYWESQYGLSDSDASDINSDTDHDSLTSLQEFNLGTSPLNPDTDRDGLADGDETNSDPLVTDTDGDGLKDGAEIAHATPSNPGLVDSDADGASDPLEIARGTDPSDPDDTPANFAQSIAINFVHSTDSFSRLQDHAVTGVLPQTNWNQTRSLNWGTQTGDQSDILLPIENTIADASGAATAMTLNWTGSNTIPRSNPGEDTDLATHRLYKANLSAYSDGDNGEDYVDLTVNLGSIPFATYDLILYLYTSSADPTAIVTLNGDPQTTKRFSNAQFEVLEGFKESITYGENRISKGNYLRFRNLSGSDCSILLHSDAWQVGLAALQILDMSTDGDSDTLPDAWELEHGLDPTLASDAAFDPDEDQLDNAGEFAQRSHPRDADSDNDRLLDGVETNTGIFVDASNTGTSPIHADTDLDEISDFDEINTDHFRTDPTLADTDGDGVSDGTEAEWRSDPNDIGISVLPVPLLNQSNDQLTWSIDDLRIRIDRSKGRELSEWGGGTVFSFQILNGTENPDGWWTLNMRLEYNNGLLGYVCSLSEDGGFRNAQGNGINLAHWGWYPEQLNPDDISYGIGLTGTSIIDYSDRIEMRFTATRTSTTQNQWTVRFEIINQDTTQPVVDIQQTNAIAANSIQDGSAFWNNQEGLPWPDLYLRQAAVNISFADGPLGDQSLYEEILDTDKDGLTDRFETSYGLNPDDPLDADGNQDGDQLSNHQEQLLGLDPTEVDSDGDNVADYWEVRYGADPNSDQSMPFAFETPPLGVGEDFDGDVQSDVWAMLSDVLPGQNDDDLDGFENSTELTWGTDPFDPTSTPEFFIHFANNTIELQWPELLYKDFDFEQSVALTNWSALSGSLQNNTRSTSLDITGFSEDSWFFRLNVRGNSPTGPSDSDNDAIGNWTEDLLGLSSISQETAWSNTQVDTDADGTPDSEVSGDLFHTYALMSDGLDGAPLSDLHASRFLSQATFGATTDSINYLKQVGLETWLNEQINNVAPTTLQDVFLDFYADYHGPRVRNDYYYFNNDQAVLPFDNMRTAWGRAALTGEDQLRQRVAFALSQILVISGEDANLDRMPISVAGFYDNFIHNAFGNYYDILEYVTFNACMGLYLSHVGNQKAQPELNIFPDENYARELMQLFTIGLWELNPDGTRRLDENGEPIPSYGQTEITELARVMTGFWFAGEDFGEGGWNDRSALKPMELHVPQHDYESKLIVGGHTIPSREPTLDNAYQDVKDAVRLIFEHPNTPIFISNQLIQFLVTDNPTPEYVERVQSVFVDNGHGERGDLGAVVRAILLDPEARSPFYFAHSDQTGFLKEPAIRLMQLGRVFKVAEDPNFQMWQLFAIEEEFSQDPLSAPSVFNFFKPHYEPSGLLGDEGMVGPVFQILHSYSRYLRSASDLGLFARGFLPSLARRHSTAFRLFGVHSF